MPLQAERRQTTLEVSRAARLSNAKESRGYRVSLANLDRRG